MSESTASPSSVAPALTPAAATPTPASPVKNVVDAFAALGSPIRWEIMRLLASGAALSARHMAEELGREFDMVSKHMKILREAGLVAVKSGEDRRYTWYYIPAAHRVAPGILDYGVCRFAITVRNRKQ